MRVGCLRPHGAMCGAQAGGRELHQHCRLRARHRLRRRIDLRAEAFEWRMQLFIRVLASRVLLIWYVQIGKAGWGDVRGLFEPERRSLRCGLVLLPRRDLSSTAHPRRSLPLRTSGALHPLSHRAVRRHGGNLSAQGGQRCLRRGRTGERLVRSERDLQLRRSRLCPRLELTRARGNAGGASALRVRHRRPRAIEHHHRPLRDPAPGTRLA